MRVRVEREAFDRALRRVVPASTDRGHLPILSGVRLCASGGGVVATATDLDLTIEADAKADVQQQGVKVVPASLLAGFVRAAADGTVELAAEGADVVVTCGEAVITLPTYDVTHWPRIPLANGEPTPLTTETLAAAARCTFATAPDTDPRHELRGVRFDSGFAFAFDGYRLAAAEITDDGPNAPAGVIPAAVVRLVAKEVTEAELVIDATRATFAAGEVAWTTRLYEHKALQWRRYFDGPPMPHFVDVGTAGLLASLDRMALLRSDIPRVVLTLDGGKLGLETSALDIGRITDQIPAQGDLPFPVIVSTPYLRDAVKAAQVDELRLEFKSARQAIVIRTPGFLQAVMPAATA